ncbi:Uncharacterised protein [Legionella sainthelensi]|nr:Uncharacterised protein [Legionella sainthelensi]
MILNVGFGIKTHFYVDLFELGTSEFVREKLFWIKASRFNQKENSSSQDCLFYFCLYKIALA